MMSNPSLAAASLLAKKLAVPRTAAFLDFRVGEAGNLGADFSAATRAAELFYRVADRLGIKIGIALTDNSSFPCSALGRLESLHLLILSISVNDPLPKIDSQHLATCIELAAHACVLTRPDTSVDDRREQIQSSLRCGGVKRTFVRHLRAQGSSLEAVERAMDIRDAQQLQTLYAQRSGFWYPPSLARVSDWFKSTQRAIVRDHPITASAERQLGFRLLVTPGEPVDDNQPVAELRIPRRVGFGEVPEFLSGLVTERPVEASTRKMQIVPNR
jgi:thymidine phosphorylase